MHPELVKENGHISDRTREEQDIVVLISESTPESPTEFRFLNGPTTFWTLAKNVIDSGKAIPMPTPLVTPTPESTPPPAESSTPSSKQHNQQNESDARFADDNGKHIWYQVDGKWKWYPANQRQVNGWPAAATLPILGLAVALPLPCPSPALGLLPPP